MENYYTSGDNEVVEKIAKIILKTDKFTIKKIKW